MKIRFRALIYNLIFSILEGYLALKIVMFVNKIENSYVFYVGGLMFGLFIYWFKLYSFVSDYRYVEKDW